MKDIELIASMIRETIRLDRDYVVAICGDEGEGKTTLAIKLAKLIDANFSMKRNMSVNPTFQEILRINNSTGKYSAIILDEAIKTMYSRDALGSINRVIQKFFAVNRKENKVWLLCMPAFSDFDFRMRRHRVKCWIQIIERGTAAVFFQSKNFFNANDRWNYAEAREALERITEKKNVSDVSVNDIMSALAGVKTLWGFINFDDMTPEEKKEYMELQENEKKRVRHLGDADKESIIKSRFVKLLTFVNMDLRIPADFLALKLNMSPDRVRQIIREARTLQEDALMFGSDARTSNETNKNEMG